MQLFTTRGYEFYEVASSLQKAIRRNDTKLAGYFAMELFASNYAFYAWRRLLTISAEDMHGSTITTEIYNLYRSYVLINETATKPRGRIFLSKAVIILCRADKNRDADHLQNLIYDKKIGITDEEIEKILKDYKKDKEDVPEYAHDIHTRKGRTLGKTKKDFFMDEYNGLEPKQNGLFDDLLNKI